MIGTEFHTVVSRVLSFMNKPVVKPSNPVPDLGILAFSLETIPRSTGIVQLLT